MFIQVNDGLISDYLAVWHAEMEHLLLFFGIGCNLRLRKEWIGLSRERVRWTKCERADKKLYFHDRILGGENEKLYFPTFFRERKMKN